VTDVIVGVPIAGGLLFPLLELLFDPPLLLLEPPPEIFEGEEGLCLFQNAVTASQSTFFALIVFPSGIAQLTIEFTAVNTYGMNFAPLTTFFGAFFGAGFLRTFLTTGFLTTGVFAA